MPIFYILSGSDIGKTYELGAGAVLGRAIENDATLRGGSISRKHARLEQQGGEWALVDLGSRNGLHLDGKRVERIELKEGGTFHIGELELRFRAEAQGVVLERPIPEEPEVQLAAQEPDELELEFEDEDRDGAITFEDADLFDAPSPALAPTPGSQAESPAPKAKEPSPSKSANRQAERMAAAGIRPPVVGTARSDGGRPALQFSKASHSTGFFSNDLGQYPLWVRLGAGLVAIAMFVGVFYFAYRSTSTLKSRANFDEADAGFEAEE